MADLYLEANVIPNTTATYDLGGSSNTFKDIYLSGIVKKTTQELHPLFNADLLDGIHGNELALITLSNLYPTSINQSLIPNANNTFDLGSSALKWKDLYLGTSATINTVVISTGSITDTTGAISFGNENLLTTGTLGAGEITGTKFLHDASTYIDKDGSNNMIFVDAVTGTKTLAELVNAAMVYPGAGIALSTGSAWSSSITDNSANWNTAYGWGNHASAGYLTSVTAHDLLSTTHGDSTASTVARGDLVVGTGATAKWDNLALGSTGKVLYSDGTDATWSATPTLTSLTIGANTLNTSEWAYLDGQNQSVFTTSSPTFVALTCTKTLTIAAPTNASAAQVEDSGYQIAEVVGYRIYSYNVINGTTYYSATYAEIGSIEIAADGTRVDLSWDAASGVDGYRILRDYNGSGWTSWYYDVDSNSYIDYNADWINADGTPSVTELVANTYLNYEETTNLWSFYSTTKAYAGSLKVGTLGGYIKGTSGLLSGQTGVPYTDLTYSSLTTGTILRATGATAVAFTTATYPATTTAYQILYSSSANVIGEITAAASSVLVTNGSNVPSLSTTLPALTFNTLTAAASGVVIRSIADTSGGTLLIQGYNAATETYVTVITITNGEEP